MLSARHVYAGVGRSTVRGKAIGVSIVPFRPDARWRARRPWGHVRQLDQRLYALGGSEGIEDREVAVNTESSSTSSSSPTGDLLIASDTPAALALAQCVQLLLSRNFEALVPYFSLDAVIKAVVTRTTRCAPAVIGQCGSTWARTLDRSTRRCVKHQLLATTSPLIYSASS
jgi:hypothetical protein